MIPKWNIVAFTIYNGSNIDLKPPSISAWIWRRRGVCVLYCLFRFFFYIWYYAKQGIYNRHKVKLTWILPIAIELMCLTFYSGPSCSGKTVHWTIWVVMERLTKTLLLFRPLRVYYKKHWSIPLLFIKMIFSRQVHVEIMDGLGEWTKIEKSCSRIVISQWIQRPSSRTGIVQMHSTLINWMNVCTMSSNIASYLKDLFPRKKRTSMTGRLKCQSMYWRVFPNWQQRLKILYSWLWMGSCFIGIKSYINNLTARYSSQHLIPRLKHGERVDKAMSQQKVIPTNLSKVYL